MLAAVGDSRDCRRRATVDPRAWTGVVDRQDGFLAVLRRDGDAWRRQPRLLVVEAAGIRVGRLDVVGVRHARGEAEFVGAGRPAIVGVGVELDERRIDTRRQ